MDVIYKLKYKKCYKKRCLACRTGQGHGPYWFSYQKVGRKTVETYYGRHKPPFVQERGRTHRTPLVGREKDVARVQNILVSAEAAVDGSPQSERMPHCVFLLGEVGIGKSRIAEEVAHYAVQRAWNVVFTHAYTGEGELPYRVWITILRKLLVPGSWHYEQVRSAPEQYDAISLLVPDLVSFPGSATRNAAFDQLRLWEAIRALLALVVEQSPLLLVFDDLHAADEQSVHLLLYLVRHLTRSLVFVSTCRENELTPQHLLRALLANAETAVSLSLGPLSSKEIAQLVKQVAPPLSTVQYDVIRERAAGNPFFAEELAQTFVLHHDNGLATSITSVLEQRIQHLSPGCRQLLGTASVLGGTFDYSLLLEVAFPQQGRDEDTMIRLLEEACHSGLLTEEGITSLPTYVFWHPMLVQHLYTSLSGARRTSLHRRAAAVFEQTYRGRDAEGAALIVHHLVCGGADAPRIALYAERAGDAAYALAAYAEAEKQFSLAIAHASSHEEVTLAPLLEKLAESARIQGKYEQARSLYQRVLALSSSHAAPRTAQEQQRDALLMGEVGLTWYDVGDIQQAHVWYGRAETRLHTAAIEGGPAWANIRYRQSYALWQEGRIDEAHATASEALSLFHASLSGHTMPQRSMTRIERSLLGDPVDIGRVHLLLGSLASVRGDQRDAQMHLCEALRIYDEYRCYRDIAVVCSTLGDAYLRTGDYDRARSSLLRAQDLAERSGDIPHLAVIAGNFGILALRREELLDAEQKFLLALSYAEATDDDVYVSMLCAYLALTLQARGCVPQARATLARSLRLSRVLQTPQCTGLALVVRCSLYVSEAEHAERPALRARCLDRALHLLERVTALPGTDVELQAEALFLSARLAHLRGDALLVERTLTRLLVLVRQSQLTWFMAVIRRQFGETPACADIEFA